MHIGATITCYNDQFAAKKLLDSLRSQIHPLAAILIVDNSKQQITLDTDDYNFHICIKHFPENIGVSGAITVSLEWAHENQLEWLWLFDQDSIPAESALAELMLATKGLPVSTDTIGILAPAIFDSNSNERIDGFYWNRKTFIRAKKASNSEPYECDAVINSGALINLNTVQRSDLPPPKLFIDGVDFMFCYKLRLRGLKIFVVPSSTVNHNLGNPKPVKIPFIKRKKFYYHLSPLRVFCICRNFSFIELKYSKWPHTAVVVYLRIKHCLYFIIGALFGAEKKLQTIHAAISGTFQGFLGEKFWGKKPPLVP